MSDPATDDGIALSAYEAKLVVAALCRYASQGDVHPSHRDRCERLADALAGEHGVTLTVADAAGGAAGGRAATADAGSVRDPDGPAEGVRGTARAGGATRGPDAVDAATADAAGGATTTEGTAARDGRAEDAFRWGPDRADG